MPKYSYLNIIKSGARQRGKQQKITHTAALEAAARKSGFANYHDLSTFASHSPTDATLMFAALGVTDLGEVVYEPELFGEIDSLLDSVLAGEIASTNASMFMLENMDVLDVSYCDETGTATISTAFEFNGEQEPDRVFSGDSFSVTATVRAIRRTGQWRLSETDGLEIHTVKEKDYRG